MLRRLVALVVVALIAWPAGPASAQAGRDALHQGPRAPRRQALDRGHPGVRRRHPGRPEGEQGRAPVRHALWVLPLSRQGRRPLQPRPLRRGGGRAGGVAPAGRDPRGHPLRRSGAQPHAGSGRRPGLPRHLVGLLRARRQVFRRRRLEGRHPGLPRRPASSATRKTAAPAPTASPSSSTSPSASWASRSIRTASTRPPSRRWRNPWPAFPTAKGAYYYNLSRAALLRQAAADKAPPRIKIDAPADGLLTNALAMEVRGTAESKNQVAVVEVNGESQLIDAAIASQPFTQLARLAPGTNAIEVVAKDLLGQEAKAVVNVVVDREGPVVVIDRAARAGGRIRLEGTVFDNVRLGPLVVNGQSTPLSAGTESKFTADVAGTETAFQIEAADAVGNFTRVRIPIPTELRQGGLRPESEIVPVAWRPRPRQIVPSFLRSAGAGHRDGGAAGRGPAGVVVGLLDRHLRQPGHQREDQRGHQDAAPDRGRQAADLQPHRAAGRRAQPDHDHRHRPHRRHRHQDRQRGAQGRGGRADRLPPGGGRAALHAEGPGLRSLRRCLRVAGRRAGEPGAIQGGEPRPAREHPARAEALPQRAGRPGHRRARRQAGRRRGDHGGHGERVAQVGGGLRAAHQHRDQHGAGLPRHLRSREGARAPPARRCASWPPSSRPSTRWWAARWSR